LSLALQLLLAVQTGLAPPVELGAAEPPAAQSCPPAGAPVVRRLALGGIRYCGRIDDEGVRQAAEMLRREDSRLVITSVGGNLDAPLALAALVLRERLDVEVAGPCFSACASIIFVAGNHRIVSATGVLGFHNTNSSAFMLASHLFAGRGSPDMGNLRRRASEEIGIYARRAIDPTLLVRPQVEIGTLCVRRADASSPGEPVFNLASRLDLWVPDLATLRAFGVELAGDYPVSPGDAAGRLDRYLGPSGPQFRFSFGGQALSSRLLYRRLYAIGAC
jgi:hypothetical protein